MDNGVAALRDAYGFKIDFHTNMALITIGELWCQGLAIRSGVHSRRACLVAVIAASRPF